MITTINEGRRFGLTATAVCPLSTDPPSLLVCINRSAEAHDPLLASRKLCINVLTDEQSTLATCFSGSLGHKGEDRFAAAEWHELTTGCPGLCGAAAVFDCTVFAVTESKTHSIFTCLVEDIEFGKARGPLIYANQQYGGVCGLGAVQ